MVIGSDEKLAKEAVTLKTNKLTQEKLVLDEKKEKLDKAEKEAGACTI